jgi:cation-transporting ATPase 13A1
VECQADLQRVRTLTEFRTMSITPYHVQAYRDGKWQEVMSSDLVPGDLVSVRKSRLSWA